MRYNTALSIRHFSDSGFCLLMRHLVLPQALADPNWPKANEQGRFWEWTNLLRAMRDFGYLSEPAEVLIVGSGFDLLAYHVSDYVGKVVCTQPLREAPCYAYPCRPDRIEVASLPTLKDRRFDVVLAGDELSRLASTIEVRSLVGKLASMLKPGGALGIGIEILRRKDRDYIHDKRFFFSPATVRRDIIEAAGLIPVDEPDLTIDDETCKTAYPFDDAAISGPRSTSVALTRSDDVLWTHASFFMRRNNGAPDVAAGGRGHPAGLPTP